MADLVRLDLANRNVVSTDYFNETVATAVGDFAITPGDSINTIKVIPATAGTFTTSISQKNIEELVMHIAGTGNEIGLDDMLNAIGGVITVDDVNLMAHNQDSSIVATVNKDYSVSWAFSDASVNLDLFNKMCCPVAVGVADSPVVRSPEVSDTESQVCRDELEQLMEFAS